ncbi:MAG: hypothetical protein ACTSV5_09680 [Promethearchaeota archaeon]
METFCLSIGKFAWFLGVCTKTLRRGNSEGRSNSAQVSVILLQNHVQAHHATIS